MFRSKLLDEMRPYASYIIIVIVYIGVISSTLVFIPGYHLPVGSRMIIPQTGSSEFAGVTREIIPSIDMTLGFGNAALYVPKGSTNMAGYLSMTLREPDLFLSADGSGWTRPFVVDIEYQNYQGTPTPSISLFNPVQICFQVNEKMWRDYTRRPAAYQFEYYAEALSVPRWVALPMNTDPEHLQLCGESDHLSIFALAIKVARGDLPPMIPITGATPFPTNAPTDVIPTDLIPTKEHDKDSLFAVPPTVIPTAVPPTVAPTANPPTTPPTDIVPTDPPATDPPTDIVPTDPPATDCPPDNVPTDPPATDPPATDPPMTDQPM
jgi:hypothetical protein